MQTVTNHRAILVSLAAAVLGLGACGGNEAPALESPFIPSASVELPIDPYSSSGSWKIPEQVQPGRYRVTANSDPVVSLRWYTLCRDPFCEDTISETTSYASEGGDYVTIPSDGSVRGIKNNGVKLGPAE
jgi:hypothetical protein